MEPREGEKTDDEKIAEEIDALGSHFILDLVEENKELESDLLLINDALISKVISDWMPIESVINDLTDKKVIEEVIEGTRPESRFHQNRGTVAKFVACLKRWREKGALKNQDQLVRAGGFLSARLKENSRILKNYR